MAKAITSVPLTLLSVAWLCILLVLPYFLVLKRQICITLAGASFALQDFDHLRFFFFGYFFIGHVVLLSLSFNIFGSDFPLTLGLLVKPGEGRV
jgi:uncharacterized membrane protein